MGEFREYSKGTGIVCGGAVAWAELHGRGANGTGGDCREYPVYVKFKGQGGAIVESDVDGKYGGG